MRIFPIVVFLFISSPTWASCLVAGDSIAAGAGPYTRCTVNAQAGISTEAIIPRVSPGFDLTIVSAGSNHGGSPRDLDAIRAKVTGTLVLILPTNKARSVVAEWASAHGVATISFVPGGDGVHPASYESLAAQIEEWNEHK